MQMPLPPTAKGALHALHLGEMGTAWHRTVWFSILHARRAEQKQMAAPSWKRSSVMTVRPHTDASLHSWGALMLSIGGKKSHQRQKPGMLDVPPPLQHGTLNKVTWKGRLRWQPGQAMASSRSHSHGPALQPTAAPGRCLMFSKGKPLQWLCVRAGYKPKQPLIMLAGCK